MNLTRHALEIWPSYSPDILARTEDEDEDEEEDDEEDDDLESEEDDEDLDEGYSE